MDIEQLRYNVAFLKQKVSQRMPLVCCITNYVTVNDCANALLSIGAFPAMTDEAEDVIDLLKISSALVINIGTINKRTLETMVIAAKEANKLNIPVILDPVGYCATNFRKKAVERILKEAKIDIIKGNYAEIAGMAGVKVEFVGVESCSSFDEEELLSIANKIALKNHCVVAITGNFDVISDGKNVVKILNGNQKMEKVSGTGCMITALIGGYASVTDDRFLATVCGVATMSIAGEIAYSIYGSKGTGSYRVEMMNAICKLDQRIFFEKLSIRA